MTPVIVWFRRNLRLADNAALTAAAASGQPVLPVYVLDEDEIGSASRWWLHHSLASLDASLQERGGRLLLLAGPADVALKHVVEQSGADQLFFPVRFEPSSRRQQKALRAALAERIDLRPSADGVVNHPRQPLTKGGSPFRVFTPYWRAASALGAPPAPQPFPDPLRFATSAIDSLRLEDAGLLPQGFDWTDGMQQTWTPGEHGALQRLDDVELAAKSYDELRDRPDLDATSRLSPHLHFGEVSPGQVWHALDRAAAHLPSATGVEALRRQLFWRDFSAYLLNHFPALPTEPLRDEFRHFPWSEDDEGLRAWQRGRTGYPIVDAGMRQLWTSGWMHNRVRMIVASFLVKHLLVPWQHGADWFLDTLVDADLANNSAGWQWVAGCGTDSTPYFRIFNPITQGKKFDVTGDYVREFVPELARVPVKFIHDPWNAPAEMLAASGVRLGEDYPHPIVDHPEARQRALDAYQLSRDLLKSGAS